MTNQSTPAAERSVHVTRGNAPTPSQPEVDPFITLKDGTTMLRALYEARAQRDWMIVQVCEILGYADEHLNTGAQRRDGAVLMSCMNRLERVIVAVSLRSPQTLGEAG